MALDAFLDLFADQLFDDLIPTAGEIAEAGLTTTEEAQAVLDEEIAAGLYDRDTLDPL